MDHREYEEELARAGSDSKSIKKPASNPLLLRLSPDAYVMKTLAGVKSSDLEQALLVMPFTQVH